MRLKLFQSPPPRHLSYLPNHNYSYICSIVMYLVMRVVFYPLPRNTTERKKHEAEAQNTQGHGEARESHRFRQIPTP